MKSKEAKEFIDGCMDHLTVEMTDHAKWQLRAAMTRPVGERFVYEGETVEVVGYDRNKEGCACRDCARFGNCSYNEMTGNCRWYEREDGTDVIFRKVEQVNCLI